jgi:diguanylate cyclase (GGDEF)-like protein
MHALRKLLHPKIRAKLLIGVVVAACAAIAVQFAISSQRVESNLGGLEVQRLSEDLEVARGALDQLRINLERAATGSSVSLRLADAVDRGDRRWLRTNVVTRLARTYSAQSVTVLDVGARPLAVAGLTLVELPEESAIAQSAEMNVVVSKYVYMSGGLWLIATAPIVGHDYDDDVHGVLVLAQLVDNSFAGIVSSLINNEVTFFVKGQVAATTDRKLASQLEAPEEYTKLEEAHDLVVTPGYASRGSYLGVDGTDGLIVVSNERAPIAAAQKALQRSMLVALVPAIVLACLVAIVLSGKLGRPLRSLRAAVNATAFGDLEQRVDVRGDDEIADLGRAFNAMAERVSAAQETLRRAAVRDSLTGLLNHREFYHRLTDEIARGERSKAPVSVLMIDLDYFKGINDTYGHLRGDAVLREVASVITRGVREGDVVSRYAGDEFAVILPATAEGDAFRIAERIRSSVEGVVGMIDLPDEERVTLSIGIATRWPGEHTANETVELADQALYHAKEGGRNRVSVSAGVTG